MIALTRCAACAAWHSRSGSTFSIFVQKKCYPVGQAGQLQWLGWSGPITTIFLSCFSRQRGFPSRFPLFMMRHNIDRYRFVEEIVQNSINCAHLNHCAELTPRRPDVSDSRGDLTSHSTCDDWIWTIITGSWFADQPQ